MSLSFLKHINDIEDPRIPGMTTYPLNEILLTVFIGMLCKLEDLEEIEDFCAIELAWLRRYLPFANGIAPAQTLRRTLARLEPRHLEKAFTHWAASLTERIRGVIAIDGKAVRGSKQEADGAGRCTWCRHGRMKPASSSRRLPSTRKATRSLPFQNFWRCSTAPERSSLSMPWAPRRQLRSEERRVGQEGRRRGWPDQ